MLVTDQFVYLHMPKTAGTWVQHYLFDAFGGTFPSPLTHVRIANFEDRLGHKLVIGSTRDPWSWYLSMYQFLRATKWWRDSFLSAFGDPDDHHAALYGMTHPNPKVSPRTRKIPFNLPTFQAGSVGLYSHLFRASFCDRQGRLLTDVLIDTAHIRRGLREVVGIDLSDEKRYPPQQVKEDHPHTILDPTQVWTPEHVQWVREADREAIDLLGYSHPGKPTEPVRWVARQGGVSRGI